MPASPEGKLQAGPAAPAAGAPFVGLTGAVAAGKSAALEAFGRQGAATLSADRVVHDLLAADRVRERLVDRWGADVAPDGEVDRARVGAIVFDRPGELVWLEELLHPLVAEDVARWRAELPTRAPLAVVEVPLLFETGMDGAFDATVCVVARDEARAARAGDRGTQLLEGRSGRQLTQDEKAARATHVIANDGDLAELDAAVARLVGRLVAGAREEA